MSHRKYHHHNSHRDRTSPLHRPVSPHSPAPSFSLAVCVWATVPALPNLVHSRIRDRTWALVCKPSKRKRLAHLEDLVSVHLVLEHRVPCCVRRCPIRRGKRLRSRELVISHFLCAPKPEEATRLTSAGMSSSKCRVSSALRSCGLKGASVRWILSQSIPLNQTCACVGSRRMGRPLEDAGRSHSHRREQPQ